MGERDPAALKIAALLVAVECPNDISPKQRAV
jgi:hypothetical protein